MSIHDDCFYNCGATDCDAPEAPPRQRVASNDGLCCTCTADAPMTEKQEMLMALHAADEWHAEQAQRTWSKKKRSMHWQYQGAIWWAIEQLDDECVTIRAT